MTESEWLRPTAAADYLGVSASFMAKLRMTGRGPRYYKRSRVVIYRRSDLDRWIGESALTSTSGVSAATRAAARAGLTEGSAAAVKR